jgi:hypothetical protein
MKETQNRFILIHKSLKSIINVNTIHSSNSAMIIEWMMIQDESLTVQGFRLQHLKKLYFIIRAHFRLCMKFGSNPTLQRAKSKCLNTNFTANVTPTLVLKSDLCFTKCESTKYGFSLLQFTSLSGSVIAKLEHTLLVEQCHTLTLAHTVINSPSIWSFRYHKW